MSFRPFTSESYAQADRPEAWRDVLGAVGLKPSQASAFYDGHATASHRQTEGVALTRLSAGGQAISLDSPSHAGLPIALLPIEDGTVLRNGSAHRIVPVGHLLLLPRSGDWSLVFQRDLRAIVLSVTSEALHGRITAKPRTSEPQVIAPGGFADVFSRMLDATARTLETLDDGEWAAIAQSLVDLLLTLVYRRPAPRADGTPSATQAAILHRICQTIERRLDDPELSPSRVALSEGISERYLQKLFEGAGDNFTHYVRERRLQRAWADLSNPAEARQSISEIAFRFGFSDSAHFSRTFRQRFGLSPREFRQQEAERVTTPATARGQRGWPHDALAQVRAQQPSADLRKRAVADCGGAAPAQSTAPSHHHLSVEAARVHWGYFSRSLPPQAEIASGDTITVETLTQHASDDPELMIAGDPGAESVFGWTATKKNVDRRGAGPMDASVFGRGAGEGFGVHICTGPIAVKDAQPGDVLEVRILDIVPRPSQSTGHKGRVFGSSVAAWWGYHYNEFLCPPRPREAVTIYEIFDHDEAPHARALYSYRWEPQTDPSGVVHETYDYPGIPVAASSAGMPCSTVSVFRSARISG